MTPGFPRMGHLGPSRKPTWSLYTALLAPASSRVVCWHFAPFFIQKCPETARNRMGMKRGVTPGRWTRASCILFTTNFVEMPLANDFSILNATEPTYILRRLSQFPIALLPRRSGFWFCTEHWNISSTSATKWQVATSGSPPAEIICQI